MVPSAEGLRVDVLTRSYPQVCHEAGMLVREPPPCRTVAGDLSPVQYSGKGTTTLCNGIAQRMRISL